MIEGLEITTKVSIEQLMTDHYDLVLFEKEKVFHITIEYGEIETDEYPSVEKFRKNCFYVNENDELDDYLYRIKDDRFTAIKEKYPDIQKVYCMFH